ncbi:hypothetical protein JCM17478_17960 [Thermopirellula anaerolimosa]
MVGSMESRSRLRRRSPYYTAVILAAATAVCVGCGTSKWTETRRTATEQLLISASIDQAVSQIDFRALVGKKVFLDDSYLKDVVDSTYLVSSLRQQLLAGGAILTEKKEQADYIVEVRSGAVGTDMHSLLIGVPQTNLPSALAAAGAPSNIPEIPFVKRTKQTAVTKILLFAYQRESGRPLWQSGQVLAKSWAQDVWILGAGPFQRGDIYSGTQIAGEKLDIPFVNFDRPERKVSATEEVYFLGNHDRPKQPVEGTAKSGGSNVPIAPENGQEGVVAPVRPSPPVTGPNFPMSASSPPGASPTPGTVQNSAASAAWWQWDPSGGIATPSPPR